MSKSQEVKGEVKLKCPQVATRVPQKPHSSQATLMPGQLGQGADYQQTPQLKPKKGGARVMATKTGTTAVSDAKLEAKTEAKPGEQELKAVQAALTKHIEAKSQQDLYREQVIAESKEAQALLSARAALMTAQVPPKIEKKRAVPQADLAAGAVQVQPAQEKAAPAAQEKAQASQPVQDQKAPQAQSQAQTSQSAPSAAPAPSQASQTQQAPSKQELKVPEAKREQKDEKKEEIKASDEGKEEEKPRDYALEEVEVLKAEGYLTTEECYADIKEKYAGLGDIKCQIISSNELTRGGHTLAAVWAEITVTDDETGTLDSKAEYPIEMRDGMLLRTEQKKGSDGKPEAAFNEGLFCPVASPKLFSVLL
jgi:hypothetical protein